MFLPHFYAGNRAAVGGAASSYLPSDNPASLVGWFRMGVGVTSSGGFASAWADQSGNGHDLLQGTATNQPAYDGTAILTFDGVDNFMQTAAFTLNVPIQVSALVRQISFTNNDTFWDGIGVDLIDLFQNVTSPNVALYSGLTAANNTNMTIGTFFAVTALYNGASSSLKVGSTAATTGNPGTRNAGGFTLGSGGNAPGPSAWVNADFKDCLLYTSDAADE